MKRLALFIGLLLPCFATAQVTTSEERQRTFGSVVAPTALPSGGMAVYGFVGVPEIGAGFRQGTSVAEFEARARANYLLLSVGLEVLVRRTLVESGGFTLAPYLGVGFVLASGSTYFDEANFAAASLRVMPGLVASWTASETVRVLGLVDVPLDFGFSPRGAQRHQALLGGGVELYLGQDISLLAAGQLGPEVTKEPLAVTDYRLGYSVRLGLGLRIF